jgi:hypothetical protein
MSKYSMTEVKFDIHGAVCHSCNDRLDIYIHCAASHEMLSEFHKEHGTHTEFRWLAKISAPSELANDKTIELGLNACES